MGKNSYVDIAIITALPEEIFAAISIFDAGEFKIFKSDGCTYLYGSVTTSPSFRPYKAVITIPNYYGGTLASSLATDIANKWNPDVFFLSGIAAGNPRKVKLGDLALANEVFEILFQKFTKGKVEERSRSLDVLPSLVQQCAESAKNDWHALLSEPQPKPGHNPSPALHVGPVISTNSVFGSDQQRDALLKDFPDALAIEMEAAGVIQGVEFAKGRPARCLVVKGISDYGGDHKADNPWRKYAAQSAAAFIKSFLLQDPFPRHALLKGYPRGVWLASEAEKYNWLGDIEFNQGSHKSAESNYTLAWENINKEKNELRRRDLSARISLNLGHIKRLRGSVTEAHHFCKISMILSTRLNENALADTYYSMGLIAREYGEMKLAMRYLERASQHYKNLGNHIGQTSAERWQGYTWYSLGDYEEAYKLIIASHNTLIQHAPSYNRIPEGAESFDILGRVLRQLAIKYRNRSDDYMRLRKKPGFGTLPQSIELCQKQALDNYREGEKIALKIGDKFRLAESYLSFLIFFYEFPDLDFYSNEGIHPWKALKQYYERGEKLASDNEYYLLSCIFEKYIGNAYFQKQQYKTAFEHYAKRYWYSKKVRPIEQDNALEEMTTKLIELTDTATRQRCIAYFMECLAQSGIQKPERAISLCNDLIYAIG